MPHRPLYALSEAEKLGLTMVLSCNVCSGAAAVLALLLLAFT
jgi:hypothetical protein